MAFAAVAPKVVGVKGNEPPLPLWSAEQPKTPLFQVRKKPASHNDKFAPKRREVDAVDAKRLVVVAFVDVVFAKMLPPVNVLFEYVFGILVEASAKNIADEVLKKLFCVL